MNPITHLLSPMRSRHDRQRPWIVTTLLGWATLCSPLAAQQPSSGPVQPHYRSSPALQIAAQLHPAESGAPSASAPVAITPAVQPESPPQLYRPQPHTWPRSAFTLAQQPAEGAIPPVTELVPPPPADAAATSRLRQLRQLPPELRTPEPSPEVQREYNRFVQGIVSPEATLDVLTGRTRILELRQAPIRVFIPDEEVARYQLISERELAIVGVREGTTVLNLWMPDPQAPDGQRILSYLVRVLPEPQLRERLEEVYAALEKEINQAFPNSFVRLSLIGDQLVVRGEARDAVEANQILKIVIQHAPPSRRGERLRRERETVILASGQAELADVEASRLRQEVIDAELQGEANIVNLLQIPGEQQVMLRVTVAEVNRTAARSIGLNFSLLNDDGLNVFSQLTGAISGAGQANLPTLLDNGQVQLAINALRSMELARTLAEPTLTTLNGRTATFSSGGSFPVPSANVSFGAAAQSVAFVPFGVQLQFTPFIVDRDRIRLQVAADVSTRDNAQAADVGGTSVPGLNSNNFVTTVELRKGQTLAVAGLLQTNFGAQSDRVPFWGDLPIIGRTGGFDRTSAGEKELVILITPELVHPLEACEGPPLPGADVFEPGDVEFYLLGRLESRRAIDYRSSVRTDFARQKAHIHCQDAFLIGPHGHSYNCCPPKGAPCPK